MDRFSRLEFGDDTTPRDDKPRGEPIRDAGYYHQEAMKYWLAADYELALRHYSRMLEQNNALFDAWAGQVLMLIELGEYPEACVWADKALESFPEHPELLALKGLACLRDARMEQAVAYSDNAVSKDNLPPRVWLVRAEVFLDRKGPIAEGCVNKAIACAGKSLPIVHLEAGRLFRRKGRYVQALQHLKQAVEGFPRSALAWYELGSCQASLGLSEAVHSLEQSRSLRPDWEPVKTALRDVEKRGFFGRFFGR
ncbi:MAG: tetratricopeptide repeat protein [Solirubrobacterales bacterium]